MKSFGLMLLALVASLSKVMSDERSSTDVTLEHRVKELEEVLHGLSRQVMLQQFFAEEKTRADGNSGLKHTRMNIDGTRNYYETAYIQTSFMAMHDHANYDRTIGLGECMIVMNGVQFRTRHNDYKLTMPSSKDQNYNSYEDIPFPNVPKSVLSKKTVQEQIDEMAQYFRAFKEQDVKIRNYLPYFKPVLCYIEGAWTKVGEDIEEPFQSDRHSINAFTWDELMEKVRFTSYSGSKSVLENYAYLPTTIINVDNGIPEYAQWSYRIMCHPLRNNLSSLALKQEDDLLFRFPNRLTPGQVKDTRQERFKVNAEAEDHYGRGKSLLDDLMMEIPGKDNYQANLRDDSFNMEMEDVRDGSPLNTGYYHRYFRTEEEGAMGTKEVHRGFSDANLWVAETTQPKVAPMSVTDCKKNKGKKAGRVLPFSIQLVVKVKKQVSSVHIFSLEWMKSFRQSSMMYQGIGYSYALPLEIIYLTPLFKWNPYDIEGDLSYTVIKESGKRKGGFTQDTAYNGTNSKFFYHTPLDFYGDVLKANDPADTARGGVGVLNRQGEVCAVTSSGTRIVTPPIKGVGPVRLRYPIIPIHEEGSSAFKELNALKDMTMKMNRYSYLFHERPGLFEGKDTPDQGGLLHFQTSVTYRNPPGEHAHDFYITAEELEELKNGQHIFVTTSTDMGHSHVLELKYKNSRVKIHTCDGRSSCWDGHNSILFLQKT